MNPQLDLLAGKAERDRGLERVEENSRSFLKWARLYAKHYADEHHGIATIDDVRYGARLMSMEPHHRNVWGSIFRGSEWECVGRRLSKIKSNHARSIGIWRLRK